MATFHLFPQLPPELRIRIWEFVFEQDRILDVRKGRRHSPSDDYWSPDPVPAVTRACRESRKYCSYQKAFVVDGSSRYIWTKFDSDIIHLLGTVMGKLAKGNGPDNHKIRRLRIDLANMFLADELAPFYRKHSKRFRCFPRLDGVDILKPYSLWYSDGLLEMTDWGACPASNVRIIDADTGEWVDAQTAGPYQDWLDTDHGENRDFKRVVPNWNEGNEEDVAKRYNAMMKIHPLPRIDLNN